MTRSRSSEHPPSPKEVYQDRRLDLIAARWGAKAADWDRNLEDPACHLNEDQSYARFLDHAVSIIRQQRAFCAAQGVIDAGCATGLVLARIVRWFAWGVGVDISPDMIRRARAKEIPKAKFVVGDCFRLGKSCSRAGAIISRGVLLSHYGPEQGELLLKSAHDCLLEQGFAFWDFLNRTDRHKYRHVPENKTFFDAREVSAMARRAGFQRVKVYGEAERRVRMVLAQK